MHDWLCLGTDVVGSVLVVGCFCQCAEVGLTYTAVHAHSNGQAPILLHLLMSFDKLEPSVHLRVHAIRKLLHQLWEFPPQAGPVLVVAILGGQPASSQVLNDSRVGLDEDWVVVGARLYPLFSSI